MGHPVLYQTIFYLDYNNATPKKKSLLNTYNNSD